MTRTVKKRKKLPPLKFVENASMRGDIEKRKAKSKVVRSWAALHPTGDFIGVLTNGFPTLYPNRAVAKERTSALAKVVRVRITVIS